MDLSATVGGAPIEIGDRDASTVTWGLVNPRSRADLTVLEGGLFIAGESAAGDALGVRASVGSELRVYSAGGSTLEFFGYVITRSKAMINQTDPPFLVDIAATSWEWRLKHPPAYLTKTYQDAAQTDKAIIEDALELCGFGETDPLSGLAVNTGRVSAVLSPVPPIAFEDSSPWEVLEALATLSGAKWYANPDLSITYNEQRFFQLAPFEVEETF